jgi:voltage-gated sodium channel
MAAALRASAHNHGGSSHTLGGGKTNPKARASKVVIKLEEIEHGLRETETVVLPWIKSPKADAIFGVIIMLNAAFIGFDLEFAPDGFSWGFWSCETVFLLVFLVELAMRMVAECPAPWRFFFIGWEPQYWGLFDFAVTIIGCVDAWVVTPVMAMNAGGGESPMSSFTVLRVFRLVRLARLIRVLRMFNELVILVHTLGNSMRAVGWMSLLLGMIIYTGSIVCVILLGEPNKDNEDINKFFGTLGDALFSHFCVVTLEAWPDIAQAAMQQSPMWAFYFVAMITLTNFALVNLMVGVIVERIIHFSLEQESELSAFVAESEQFRHTLNTLFQAADIDHNGEVTREEIRQLMEDKRTHEIMEAFGINLDIPPNTLFTIMDISTDGPTTFEEFFNACMRLCGSKQSIHSIFVQHDICEARSDLCRRLGDLEEHLGVQGSGHRPQMASRSSGVAMSSSAAGDAQQASSPEECMTELLERMDRFGQVQLQICAEVEALKEHARGRSSSKSANAPPFSSGPALIDKAPTELGSGCIDTLFCRRKEPIAKPSNSRDSNIGKQTRKDLEAEFRKARK